MAGIVLAGGKSVRMGQDKALLPYGGATLLAQIVEMVRAAAGDVVVVADIADKYTLPGGVQVLGDLFPGAGPLGGIVTGLEAMEDGYHLVVGCDMPGLRPALIALLLREAEGHDGAIPEVAGRLEPLCAVYHRRCAEHIRAFLEAGGRAAHQAAQTLAMQRVGEAVLRQADPDLRSFTNLNAPEEYRQAVQRVKRET